MLFHQNFVAGTVAELRSEKWAVQVWPEQSLKLIFTFYLSDQVQEKVVIETSVNHAVPNIKN